MEGKEELGRGRGGMKRSEVRNRERSACVGGGV